MKQLAKKIVGKFGYQVQGTRYSPRQLLEPSNLRHVELADVIFRRMFEFGKELTFIQVGAFDGITVDPLQEYIGKYGWRGIMLEPQPGPARQLRELYRDNDRIIVLEAALDNTRRKRSLFTVESDAVPVWARGMASFQRDHIVKHAYLIPGLEEMVKETLVDCITFDDVFDRLPSNQVDLLQIDAEGADAYILSLFPFDQVRPPILHWEIKNLSKEQREDCFDKLSAFGYRFAPSGDEDMLGVLN